VRNGLGRGAGRAFKNLALGSQRLKLGPNARERVNQVLAAALGLDSAGVEH
jgi:hypothetical protein